MTLYEFKMHLKRLKIVKAILKSRTNKGDSVKQDMLQDEGLDLIKSVENTLKNSNYIYFADYGTLLGIIRDHAFISWDNDVDYGLLIDDSFDWNQFEKHMNQYGFKKIREFIFQGKISEQTYSLGSLSVDFFGHFTKGDKTFAHSFFRQEDYIYHSKDEFHVRLSEYVKLTDTKIVDFLGTTVHVPVNSEEYLESIYTKTWRIPNPKWSDTDYSNRKISVLDELGEGYFFD